MTPAAAPAETDPAAAGRGTVTVVLNPAAHSTKAARRIQAVRALACGARVWETRGPGDARKFARELAESGCGVVVAAGGDGTVNEVVSGLLEANVPLRPALGVLPMGTMNVLALELRLPVLRLDECWKRIEHGRSRSVDVWQAGCHHFIQMAGVGIDAQVIRQTSWAAKKQWGPLSYLGTLARVLDQPPAEVRVSIDHGPWLSGTSVLLGNGRLYGGPFPVFPDAAHDDGMIDVAVVHGHGPATFSNLVADVLLREIDEHHEVVSRHRGRHVRIEAPVPLPYEVDGELGGETPLTVTRHPVPLRIIA